MKPPGLGSAQVHGTRNNDLVKLLPSRLSAYAGVLFIGVGVVQLVASILFYRSIDEGTLREDHARRVAEMLVVSLRVQGVHPRLTAAVMTSQHLQVSVTSAPLVSARERSEDLQRIERKIREWEPSLANKTLNLRFVSGSYGRQDLVGSMQTGSDVWINFRSPDISSMWPVALRAIWMTLVTSLLCIALGLAAIRLLTKPLQRLSEAAREIGEGRRVELQEAGPADLRDLSRAMNDMQVQLAQLIENQATSFEAISHDLRTPLARQKIAADLIADPELRDMISANVDEMEAMLRSLQQFLQAQHLSAVPEVIDLSALVQNIAAPHADKVTVLPAKPANALTYHEPMRLALSALIENALSFGARVEVLIFQVADYWRIEIRDDGPGIPDQYFRDVLAPFFRLDQARGRTTSGFGLGIPTAYTLLRRFGGDLSFSNRHTGFAVAIKVPSPLN